jgi:hypothetical protein
MLLIGVGVILGVAVTALLAVNLYVQSRGTQARIQQELAARLGTPLRIQRISVTPWSGLKLTGITMPQVDQTVPVDFLKADTFRLRIRFSSLFSGRLVIKEVSLINPTVVWSQNANGKWRLPGVAKSEEAASPASAAPEVTPTGIAAAPAAPVAPARPAAPTETGEVAAESSSEPPDARAFTPEVRRVNLVNGNFRFLDEQGKPVATFEGVDFRSNFRNATAVRGNASIEKVSLRNRFFLEQLQSPLKYDPVELDVSDISARAAGGEITGRFRMQPNDPDSPFRVAVKFRDLDADKIVKQARGPAGMIQGRLEGSFEANGKTADANALAGTGEIYLREGQVRQYSLLVALGQLLQIDELSQLRFDQAHVKYHITPGVVVVDELLLTSPNIRLSAVGTIGFNGKLRLNSQLAINERVQAQLFQAIRDNFEPVEPAGFTALNFKVSGTVERPQTDLMDKLVGPELKNLSGVISSFLGGRQDKPKKKKKPENEARAAAPPVPAEPQSADQPAPPTDTEVPTASPAEPPPAEAEPPLP